MPLVDLDQGSRALMESLGKTYSTYFLFHHYPPGEWVNFPNGAADDVHFQEAGATELAKLVVAGFRSLSSDPHVSQLIPFLKPTYKVTFNSNNPAAGLVSRTEDFPAGIKVTAYARPNPGYTFANWSGAISGTKHVTFTMGTAAKTITANFAVDGNPSTSATLQAENAAYGDGVSRRTDASGFNGTAFVNFPVTGGFLEFARIDGGSGGQATLSVRHALASGTRTGVLIVNGTSQPITFGSTGGWSTWRTHAVSIALNSGTANTIRFEASGQDLTNIDEITITTSTSSPPPAGAQTYPAEPAAIAGGVTIVSNYAGHRGTGLAAFPVNGGTLTFTQVAGNGGGAKSLAVRYANGGPSARTGALTVNGQTSPITFPRTGSWTTWATLNVPITLRADATNTVQLASTGSDLANIDEITIP
ncbi:MAG TPA: carbohydrate-binding protein [Opitutus sp.]|nr:carbohydrate-binding protein [Opitutus sp.]